MSTGGQDIGSPVIREIMEHRAEVGKNMSRIIEELERRKNEHDLSKLSPEELPEYIQYKSEIKGVPFGSDEYEAIQVKYAKLLLTHKLSNDHHPEHNDGIDNMNMFQMLEMLADWRAASDNSLIPLNILFRIHKPSPEIEQLIVRTLVAIGWEFE